MIWPLCLAFMLGNTAFIRRRVPKKFTSIISFALLIGQHSTAKIGAMPALLTKRNEKGYWTLLQGFNLRGRHGKKGGESIYSQLRDSSGEEEAPATTQLFSSLPPLISTFTTVSGPFLGNHYSWNPSKATTSHKRALPRFGLTFWADKVDRNLAITVHEHRFLSPFNLTFSCIDWLTDEWTDGRTDGWMERFVG